MEYKEAMDVVVKAIRDDENYKHSWVAAISMAVQDELRRYEEVDYGKVHLESKDVSIVGNTIAETFVDTLIYQD